jgi:AraC family transcriptional regulator, transcriptional activator of pobA
MNKNIKVKNFSEFKDYYIDGKGLVRSKNPDFHIFRFNELGDKVVKKQGPFKTEYYQFALGTSLSSNVSVYNKKFIAEAYSMVIFIPGQIIEWERTGDWDGYVINVKEPFINKAFIEHQIESYRFLQDMRPLVFGINGDEYQGLSNIYEMILIEHQKLEAENLMVIKNLMNILLTYIGRIIKSNKGHLLDKSPFLYIRNRDVANNFKRLVFKNYSENKSVSFYAKELGLTPNVLNKQVKEVFNRSPKEFINEVLLLHAETILKNPNSSVKEVCHDLNFDDYSHFVKFFKKMTGLTPAEFKSQHS